MEQYEIPVRSCNTTIQTALRYGKPKRIFIRWVGSRGGGIVINEDLTGKILKVTETEAGFEIRIDGNKTFLFKFEKDDEPKVRWGKRWAIAYTRFDKGGRMIMAHACYPNPYDPYDGPDDPCLPDPVETTLRSTNYTHLVEIAFSGKIPIKRSYRMKNVVGWHYWTIDVKKLKRGPHN